MAHLFASKSTTQKLKHITSAHIPLAKTWSQDHIQRQGELGNVSRESSCYYRWRRRRKRSEGGGKREQQPQQQPQRWEKQVAASAHVCTPDTVLGTGGRDE